jgi:hypothetical protein
VVDRLNLETRDCAVQFVAYRDCIVVHSDSSFRICLMGLYFYLIRVLAYSLIILIIYI